jgi:hypothetical protein
LALAQIRRVPQTAAAVPDEDVMIPALDTRRTAAYLARLGVARDQVTTDLPDLTLLTERHLRTIPFENLSIHLGEPIVLDIDALVDKLTVGRRGGFCYELNGAFAAWHAFSLTSPLDAGTTRRHLTRISHSRRCARWRPQPGGSPSAVVRSSPPSTATAPSAQSPRTTNYSTCMTGTLASRSTGYPRQPAPLRPELSIV